MTNRASAMFPYIWSWGTCAGCPNRDELNRRLCPAECEGKYPELGKRRGRRCRVLARGARNSARIEFEDGYVTIASRNGLRRIKESA